MKFFRKSNQLVILAVAIPCLFAISGTAFAAKPDCGVDPTHKSCGGDDGDSSDGALEAFTLNDGYCAENYAGLYDAELYGDTRDFALGGTGTGYQQCQNTSAGSTVPGGTRELFTDFQQCIIDLTVPGITFIKASFNSTRDENTGEITSVDFYFEDDERGKYSADNLLASGVPDAGGYDVIIDGIAEVYTNGKGKRRVYVGSICIDVVSYEPVE